MHNFLFFLKYKGLTRGNYSTYKRLTMIKCNPLYRGFFLMSL